MRRCTGLTEGGALATVLAEMSEVRSQRIVAWLGAVALLALGGTAGTPVARAQTGAQTSIAGQVELARLVDLAAQRLKVNVEYDPGIVKGAVTLRLEAGVTDAQLWDLTNRLLASRGLTTVVMAGSDTVSVVRLADAAGIAGISHGIGEAAPAQAAPGFRSLVVPVFHRPAREIVEALSRVLTRPGGAASVLVESGAGDDGKGYIVLSDLAPRVSQSESLVRLLDTPVAAVTVEEVPARHVSAAALAGLVTQVMAKQEAVSSDRLAGEVMVSADGAGLLVIAPAHVQPMWRQLIQQVDRREGVETVAYGARGFGVREVSRLIDETARIGPPDERWRVVADELTGMLLVTATPSQHSEVRKLMERLEALPPATRRPVRSFAIRNRSVREVIPLIQQLLNAGALGEGRPADLPDVTAPRSATDDRSRSIGDGVESPKEPAIGAPAPHEPGQGLHLSADEGTNTLIAIGEARLLEQIEDLLSRVDVRQPQVMLEVLMVSLNDSQTLDLGVELEKLNIGLGGNTKARLASLFGLSTRSGGAITAGGAGLTGVVLNPGEFSVVLRALQTVSHGRSLSMPAVLAGNNQRATLDSVLEQPFASTNASNTVSTTSFGGSLAAGTQIAIRPQIAEGDHLVLEYQVSLSSFTGAASDPALPPPRQQNSVRSVATIPDGHTVVVGGIELRTDNRSVSQVPLLGDLPVLGEIFKSRSRNDSRQRFYVFIRASVLRARGFEDLKFLSDVAAAEARVDDGWPRVLPRVIR